MRVPVDVDVTVYNGGEISKPIYLAAFFSAASAAVCCVHGVELPSILMSLCCPFTKANKQHRSS